MLNGVRVCLNKDANAFSRNASHLQASLDCLNQFDSWLGGGFTILDHSLTIDLQTSTDLLHSRANFAVLGWRSARLPPARHNIALAFINFVDHDSARNAPAA